jgi:hypothetical protein
MGYMFGREEKLHCIVDVQLLGPKDEALCVAYKTTMYAVFAPAYFHDDGYVLAVRGGGNEYYPMPEGANLATLQASGSLPNPLPVYQIPVLDYAFGYLLWSALAIGIAVNYVGSRFKARRHASLQSNLPPSTAQPELRTKTDRWLADEMKKLLQSGELAQHQAYGLDREATSTLGAASVKAMYVVLTDRRLFVVHCRVGAFGPLHENRGVKEYPRTDVAQATSDERHVRFVFRDGTVLDFFAEWSERRLSNQRRFLRDVPRLLGATVPPATRELAPG